MDKQIPKLALSLLTGKEIPIYHLVNGKWLDDDAYAHKHYQEWLDEWEQPTVCKRCERTLPAGYFDDIVEEQDGHWVRVGRADVCDGCFEEQVSYLVACQKKREDYAALRERVIVTLGGKCAVCGITDRRVLQIDHKDGRGAEDRRKHRRGRKSSEIFLNYVLEHQEKYQILCANHNWIKRVENNEGSPRTRKAP